MVENTSFDLKRPPQKPLDFSTLSKEQFDGEIEKGMDDLAEGRVVSAECVACRMRLGSIDIHPG